jgi:hypothetical protein
VSLQINVINLIHKINNKLNLQSRYERKSKIHIGQSNFFKGFFNSIGFYKSYANREVSSVYFDDQNYSFVKANIDGDFYRIKPRIRWYDNNFDNSNLEFKYKFGFNGFKYKDNSFNKKNLDFHKKLEFSKKKLILDYGLNLPICTKVTYQRKYLKHPSGIRLTIDKNIFASMYNSNQNKYEFNTKKIKLPFDVIEFKYDVDLDNFFREKIFIKLQDFPIRLTKCSKYVEAIISINTLNI